MRAALACYSKLKAIKSWSELLKDIFKGLFLFCSSIAFGVFRWSLKASRFEENKQPLIQFGGLDLAEVGRADGGTHLHLADQITIFIGLCSNYTFCVNVTFRRN